MPYCSQSIQISLKDLFIFVIFLVSKLYQGKTLLLISNLQVGDIEGDAPTAKRLRRSSSDALQDMASGEELSLYGSAPNNSESAQVIYNSRMVSLSYFLS